MTTSNWEAAINRQRELRRRGSELLYDRVKLLCNVYEDTEFHDWCRENGMTDLEYLDAELSDVACEFMTLKAVFVSHPSVEDWVGGDIRKLIAEAMEMSKTPKPPREGQSWKARALEAEKEIERLKMEIDKLESIVAELRNCLTVVASDGKQRAA
jgi:hypothetical protein